MEQVRHGLYFSGTLYIGKKYSCLLVPQTGVAHTRFDIFFNEQIQKVHATWNFLFILGFQKKAKGKT